MPPPLSSRETLPTHGTVVYKCDCKEMCWNSTNNPGPQVVSQSTWHRHAPYRDSTSKAARYVVDQQAPAGLTKFPHKRQFPHRPRAARRRSHSPNSTQQAGPSSRANNRSHVCDTALFICPVLTHHGLYRLVRWTVAQTNSTRPMCMVSRTCLIYATRLICMTRLRRTTLR